MMKNIPNQFVKKEWTVIFFAVIVITLPACKKNDPASDNLLGTRFATEKKSIKLSGTSAAVIPLQNMFGVDTHPWDFLQNPNDHNDVSQVFAPKMALMKNTYNATRLYLDWSKIEYTQGDYTFNPSHDGSWNLDALFQGARNNNLFMLADLEYSPMWLQYSYPSTLMNKENIPMPYNSDPGLPASYILQAKLAFQFAARYGSNAAVNPSLIRIASWSRWTNDPANTVQIGLNAVNYVECDNERDKWWFGPLAYQTPEQYAANMSAFYDGDQGRLGPDVGVKNADPNMKVVMGGLATASVTYVNAMIAWCKQHRGYKADGTIDLCFDVINYHWYTNDGNVLTNTEKTVGMAPEFSQGGAVADAFVALAASLPNHPEVWLTETGYDINWASTQRAIAIGQKTVLQTQGDWIIRSALFYMRHGINRLFFFQLYDDVPNGNGTFQTAGLTNDDLTNRPAANYISQVSALMGNYVYAGTINTDPVVDKYTSGSSTIYALVVPDETGRTATYKLNLGTATSANLYTLNSAGGAITKTPLSVVNGIATVAVSETPVFVQAQ